MYTVFYRILTFFRKLEFDQFITYTFKVAFVGNIYVKIGSTALHYLAFHMT